MTKTRRKAAPVAGEVEPEPAPEPVASAPLADPDVPPAEDPSESDDNLEAFGLDLEEGGPEPTPGDDPESAAAPTPEPTPEPVAAEAAGDEPPEEKAKKHEEGLRRELIELRRKLAATEAERVAPPPLPPAAQPAAEPVELRLEDVIPVEFIGDTPALSRQAIRDEARAAAREAVRPDPAQVMGAAIEQARDRWVRADATTRTPMVERVDQAAVMLNLSVDEYVRRTHHVPGSPDELLQTIEHSGIGENFRRFFPEIDIARFVDGILTPLYNQLGQPDPVGRTRRMTQYMDDYALAASWRSAVQVGAVESPGDEPAGEPSNVVPLTSRPRSMAQKGHGTQKATTDQQEFDRLDAELGMFPFAEDAEEKGKRHTALARKLGIPM